MIMMWAALAQRGRTEDHLIHEFTPRKIWQTLKASLKFKKSFPVGRVGNNNKNGQSGGRDFFFPDSFFIKYNVQGGE